MFKFFKKREMKKALEIVLADDELTDAEIEDLERRQEELGVSDDYVNKIRAKHFNRRIRPIMVRVERSRRFSPDDEQQIVELSEKLKVTPSFDPNLTMYRKLWEIETTGTFVPAPIDADIRLTKNEECYHACPAIWAQMKKYREHTGYVGGSIGFRVAKGVTLRLGKAIPTSREIEEMTDISSGRLYVTNKKLVFVGDKKSTNVTYGRLVKYELIRDGIQILKTSGKPDLFRLEEERDVEYIDALLQVMET